VRARIAELDPQEIVAITIVTYHEQTLGWQVFLAKARTRDQLVFGYSLLAKHLDDFLHSKIVSFDAPAADIYEQLRRKYPRIGTMDLRIAAIAIRNRATLVTRNLRHFRKIAELQSEDWTAIP
jgi:tRNA(fMet)-specific endonuclease VapC